MATKKTRRKKRSKAAIVLCILAIALFASGAMLVFGYYQENQRIDEMRQVVETDLFYPGISVNGIELGGMTRQQALEAVQAHDAQQLDQFSATIVVEGQNWSETIPASSNAEEIVESAYKVGRSGDLEARYNEIQLAASQGKSFATVFTSDASGLSALVRRIAEQVDEPAVDATVSSFDVKNKKFSFTEEKTGRTLDVDTLTRDIDAAVTGGEYPIQVNGQMITVEPSVTKAELEANNKLLASFETTTTRDSARNNNIKLATETINGSVLAPGEDFSFNTTTGERSTEKGYQDAGAYRNGELIPEPGGGVCQVSSTLYNAVIRAGVEIVQRNNHSQTVSYVPLGEDAMVNYPDRDFVFKNIGTGPIYIVASFADRQLRFEVYGTPILEEGVTIELSSETVEEIEPPATVYVIDPNLAFGTEQVAQKAKKGYRTVTTVQHKKGDEVLNERTYRSYYTPVAERIKHNPGVGGGGGGGNSGFTPSTGGDAGGSGNTNVGDDGIPIITSD